MPAPSDGAWSRPDRRELLRAGALYLVLTAAFLWPIVLRGESFTTMGSVDRAFAPWTAAATEPLVPQADQGVLSAPWQEELTRAVADGTLPLWGGQFGGFPQFANGASGQLYPPRLVIAALGLSPLRAHDVFSALHLLGAGLAAHLLLRQLRVGTAAAHFGASVWMLGGFSLAWLHFEVLAPALVLLPLDVWAVDRAVRRGGAPAIVLAAVLLATTLAAGQLPFMVLVFAVALAHGGVLALARSIPTREVSVVARHLARPAAAGILAASLAAVVLVPTARNLRETNREPLRYDQLAEPWSLTGEPMLLAPGRLLESFLPDSEGISVASLNAGQLFGGTITMLLAAVGVACRRRGRWLGAGLVAVTVATTVGGPLTYAAFHTVALYRYFRPYGRATLVVALGLVVLAAIGLDVLLSLLRRADEPAPAGSRRWPLGATTTVASAVLAVTALQLVVHGHDVSGTFVPRGADPLAETPLLAAARERQAASPWPARVLPLVAPGHLGMLPGGMSVLYGLDATSGYDSAVPHRTVAWSEHLLGGSDEDAFAPRQDPYITGLGGARPPRLDVAERLGVRFVALPPSSPAPELPRTASDGRRLGVAYDGDDGTLYELVGAVDPVRVQFSVVVAEGERDAFDRFLDPDFDWEREVVLERAELARSAAARALVDDPAEVGDAEAEVTAVGFNTVRIRVTTDAAGLLVIPRNWDAGWEATVGGDRTPVLRANFSQQAIAVPAGEHDVVLRYRPDGWSTGLLVSAAGMLVADGALVVHRLRRRAARLAPR